MGVPESHATKTVVEVLLGRFKLPCCPSTSIPMGSHSVVGIVRFPLRLASPHTCVLQVAVRLFKLRTCFGNPLTCVLQVAVRLFKLREGIVKTYLEVFQFTLHAFLTDSVELR